MLPAAPDINILEAHLTSFIGRTTSLTLRKTICSSRRFFKLCRKENCAQLPSETVSNYSFYHRHDI